MNKEHSHLVKSIVNAGLYTSEAKQPDAPFLLKPLVTVSRQCGAHGTRTSRLLAERLGVQLYDKELLNAIVNQTKEDKHLLASLDERVSTLMDDLLHSFFSKKSITTEVYYRYMAKVILGIAPIGGVIVGRAAHLLLPRKTAFRVRLEGSLETCAKRIAKQQEIKLDKAKQSVLKTNKQRDQFESQVSKRFPRAVQGFDLIIDTERFSSEQIVKIIITAMSEAGFQVPPAEV
ncbi:MAG: cytidylate kinase-like family protein [Magnetococcales bacterium]|nr:cytidylate kinase-like family protein [Magnetococcales bacterium]